MGSRQKSETAIMTTCCSSHSCYNGPGLNVVRPSHKSSSVAEGSDYPTCSFADPAQ